MLNKKGALELSIQTIVIIVIAMTILGLGLAFVRSQFEQVSTISTEVQQQVREQITGQLRASGEKISFPRDITFTRGEPKTITLGVQNVGERILYFKVDMKWDEGNSDFPDDVDDDAKRKVFFGLRWDQNCQQLLPADADVYGIRADPPRTPGTFALRADILSFTDDKCAVKNDPEIYTTKLAFITVG